MNNQMPGRMPVQEIAQRLGLGKLAVYRMLEQGIIPGVRLGKRWLVTRPAYQEWERTCGRDKPLDTEF